MAGKNEAFRICSSVSEALSYMPCPLQYTEPNTQNELWIFWSQYNNDFPTVFPITAATTIYHDTIKEKIVSALKNAYISDNYGCWLVQFWAPVTTKDQIFLTTCDLPFGLTKLHEGLCYYRSECLKVRIPIVTDSSENEYRLGPTGRVFKHGLPEMSPDVSRYSVADFPLHGSALTAGLGNYLAVPVFEPLSNECAGVLEIIGDKKGSFSQDLVQMVYEMLKKVELRSSNMYGHPEKKGLRGLERALKEIKDQLNFLCITHQLPLAQTWLPILDGSNVERFTTAEEQFCICTSAGYEFRAACDMFHLGKSQGVVGRAFLSHSSCFCSDITELRMSEYPLAHVAHRVGLHSSFAICLQSSYTGDYVYLLEFFLPQDNKSDCRSPQTMLNMLLASMKRQFRSFKLASGQKLGEKLSVEIIPVPSDDGLNSFEICHSVKPLSDIEAVARPGKIEWFDPLNRLLKSGNTVNISPENIDLTTSSRTANTTTKLTNVRVLTNRVFSNSSAEESMMKISEGHHRINSVMLQQSVDAKVNGTETTLASQSAPNSLGTKHFEINDMNCSSDQLESAKVADRHCEESSGGDQLCHETTTFLTHADELEFLLSGVHGDDLERLAKVYKLYDREELQAVNLRTSEVSTTQNAKVCDLSYQAALPEILEVLKSASETHGLPLAQTWVPCVQQGKGGCRHSEENLIHCVSTEDSACYVADPHVRGFHEACSEHHLLKGQGVVGIAFMTNQPCFSADLTSYRKTEYPLSHHAQMFGLQAAVAIRLRSISTGSCDFVLEFFLPSDCRNPEEHRKMLTSLSIIIQNACRTLRVVTDKELQEEVVSIGEAANQGRIHPFVAWHPVG